MSFPQQRLAEAVDRARWVRYHGATSRLMVWRGGEVIDVIDVETGEWVGRWLCGGTGESAEATVEEHLNAGR